MKMQILLTWWAKKEKRNSRRKEDGFVSWLEKKNAGFNGAALFPTMGSQDFLDIWKFRLIYGDRMDS